MEEERDQLGVLAKIELLHKYWVMNTIMSNNSKEFLVLYEFIYV